MHDRGVDVVDLGGVAPVQRLVAPLITFAVGDTAFDAATGQPVREDIRIVIPTLAALGRGHASKLGRPENDGVSKHAALLEVLNQGRCSYRHAVGERSMVALNIFVAVPVATGKRVVVA